MSKNSQISTPLDREYLDKVLSEQFTQVFAYFEDFRKEMRGEIGDIKHRLNRIEQILDESTGDYKTLVSENAANAHGITRIDNTLEDHEQRIGQLENLELEPQTT